MSRNSSSLVWVGLALAVGLGFAVAFIGPKHSQDAQPGAVINREEAIEKKTAEVKALRKAINAQEEFIDQIRAGVIHVNYDKPSAQGSFLTDNLEKLERGRELLRTMEVELESLKGSSESK